MSVATLDRVKTHTMHCMEIVGGNAAVDTAISVPGIDARIVSWPHAGNAAGGDVHYVSLCGARRLSRFAVADVSGHGDAAGEIAARLRALMRKHINRIDQTHFVRKLNEEFTARSRKGSFATALLATYYAPIEQLIVCNAGHPRPLWYRAAERKWALLDHAAPECLDSAANLPLGIVAPTEYYQFAVPLAMDDLVLIFTDAVTEARGPGERQLGEDGLLDLVRMLDADDNAGFCPSLLDALADFRGGKPPEDDLTMVLLRHKAVNSPFPSPGEIARIVGATLGLVKV